MRKVTLLLTVWLMAQPAWGHGLGQRYDLPVPLWLYLLGAALAVTASFAFLTVFRGSRHRSAYVARRCHAGGCLPQGMVFGLEALSVSVFILMLAAGLFGNQSTFKNVTPTAFWVLWWVGFTFLCAFLCNLWPLLNPAAVLFRWADRLWARWRGSGLSRNLRYPQRVGAWPAVAIFVLFAWTELVAPYRDVPRNIALAMLLYTALVWAGSYLFGARAWLRAADAFGVAFGLFGRFAPVQLAYPGTNWRWRVRPPGIGLLSPRPLSHPMTCFVLVVLATVTVDGFMETPPWSTTANVMASVLPQSPTATLLPATLLLWLAPFLFAATYSGVILAMARVTRTPKGSWRLLGGRFVLSLVPIAIAYHLAHYLSFLLLAGQLIIPLASDPFGIGWDLFGTTLYRLDIGIVDARFVWLLSVASIVVGHIVATWLSHETAVSVFATHAQVRRSQYPMCVLMIAYTVISLWILAQPIVETSPS
jgi:hypothetical protein